MASCSSGEPLDLAQPLHVRERAAQRGEVRRRPRAGSCGGGAAAACREAGSSRDPARSPRAGVARVRSERGATSSRSSDSRSSCLTSPVEQTRSAEEAGPPARAAPARRPGPARTSVSGSRSPGASASGAGSGSSGASVEETPRSRSRSKSPRIAADISSLWLCSFTVGTFPASAGVSFLAWRAEPAPADDRRRADEQRRQDRERAIERARRRPPPRSARPSPTRIPVRPSSTGPRPPGVNGISCRTRASDQPAKASIQVIWLDPMPTARSEMRKIANTARLPAIVAIVRSHQRRCTSRTVSLRNSASPSGHPSHRPAADEREHPVDDPRGEPADVVRELVAPEDEHEHPDRHREGDAADDRRGREHRVLLLLDREEEDGDHGEQQVRELVPDPGQGDRPRDGAGLEAPGPQEAERARHPDEAAAGRDVRERGRGLREEERLDEAQPGQRDHPRRRERDDVREDGDGERDAATRDRGPGRPPRRRGSSRSAAGRTRT